MRKISATVLTAAALTATALAAGPALAATSAPAVAVLTYGAPGPAGPNVPPGNVLTSMLGAPATFVTAAGVGTTCNLSSIAATVQVNPPAPGTATTQLNVQTFTSCTSTIPGVTAVTVAVNNLPNTLQFSDAPGLPVQITPPPAGPLQITITETFQGAIIGCVWRPTAGVYNGNYINAGNQIVFAKQQMKLFAGPAGPCAGPLQFFSATYRPVRDSSISGLPPVFVN